MLLKYPTAVIALHQAAILILAPTSSSSAKVSSGKSLRLANSLKIRPQTEAEVGTVDAE